MIGTANTSAFSTTRQSKFAPVVLDGTLDEGSLPSGLLNDFLMTRKQKTIEIGARPAR